MCRSMGYRLLVLVQGMLARTEPEVGCQQGPPAPAARVAFRPLNFREVVVRNS